MQHTGMAAPRETGTVHSQQKSFLIVDHTSAGRALAEALRQSGDQVMLCHRGVQALDSVRMQSWDAVVIGFRLIDMRGDAVAHAVCAERPTLVGRILILSEDVVGREAAEAAHFTWLSSDTPVETIVDHVATLTHSLNSLY